MCSATAPASLYYVFPFFFNATATTEIYTLSLHDALPICACGRRWLVRLLPVALAGAVALLATSPAFGHTNGMAEGLSPDFPHDFNQFGCTSCHSDGGVHKFAPEWQEVQPNWLKSCGKSGL